MASINTHNELFQSIINGVVLAYHTHETTGEAVLEELDLSIGEDDVVGHPF